MAGSLKVVLSLAWKRGCSLVLCRNAVLLAAKLACASEQRIVEWHKLEGVFKDHLVPTPLSWVDLLIRLPRNPSNRALNTS